MSSRLNLNDNINDKFEFSIGGYDFDLKYPSLNDIEPMSKLFEERENASAERKAEIDKETSKMMYALINPVGHNESIEKILNEQPLPVVKAFNKMLQREFSAE